MSAAARTERWFRAMGTDCHVVVRSADHADDLAGQAMDMVLGLEAQWSRFLPSSDVGRLNEADGDWVDLETSTLDLLRAADAARQATDGWFDPFLGRALVKLGYGKPFAQIDNGLTDGPSAPPTAPATGRPVVGPSPLEINGTRSAARLTAGVAFDPGGIGKGHAADLVSTWLVEQGADGALVNLGGDLRVRGRNDQGPWTIRVGNPLDESLPPVMEIGIEEVGLATSSSLKRRWRTADGRAAHHILDPRHGAPATIDMACITVVAPDAATAEMLTTSVALAGPDEGPGLLARHGAQAWVVGLDGRLRHIAP